MIVKPRTQTCEVSVAFQDKSSLANVKIQYLHGFLDYSIHKTRAVIGEDVGAI